MSGYGLSTEQIADVLERDERTIWSWQKALSQNSKSFHLALCSSIGLTLISLQMDENMRASPLWSYLKKKKRHDCAHSLAPVGDAGSLVNYGYSSR